MEQIKSFQITKLTMEGFKCFTEPTTFEFGGMNVIAGHNGLGKSSVADAIAYAIAGVPFFGGTKLDRLYHEGTRDLSVTLYLLDKHTGKPHVVCRTRRNDNTQITFDEAPVTQKDMAVLFAERDMFLSIFNPLYFIEVLGESGRELMMRYQPDIPHERVMAELSDYVRDLLSTQTFLSAAALLKKLRGEVGGMETRLVYLEGQRDGIQGQAQGTEVELMAKRGELEELRGRVAGLEAKRAAGFDPQAITDRLQDLYARHEELSRETTGQGSPVFIMQEAVKITRQLERRRAEPYVPKYAKELSQVQTQIDGLCAQLKRESAIRGKLTPGVQCPTCHQKVTAENVDSVRRGFDENIQAIRGRGTALVHQRDEITALEEKAKAVFEQYRQEDVGKAEAKLAELQAEKDRLESDTAQAAADRAQEMDDIKVDIQALELDLQRGMLSEEEARELDDLRLKEPTLTAVVETIDAQLHKADAGEEQAEIEKLKADVAEKKNLMSALGLYEAKRVELMFAGLHLNKVSISLCEVAKTTGEAKDVFRFTYDGRPYTHLSLSEKIRAGLEVSEMMKGFAGCDWPVFIDNGESVPVIDNVRPSGQTIVAQVVKGAPISVRCLDAPAGDRAA